MLLFLYVLGDDLSLHQSGEEVSVTGQNSILPKEMGNKFFNLQIIHHLDKDVCAYASWDSSIHDSIHLNKITDSKLTKLNVSRNIYFKFVFLL